MKNSADPCHIRLSPARRRQRQFHPEQVVDQAGMTNAARAVKVDAALSAYRGGERPDDSHYYDFLSDFMHYCDRERLDFEKLLALARSANDAERGTIRS